MKKTGTRFTLALIIIFVFLQGSIYGINLVSPSIVENEESEKIIAYERDVIDSEFNEYKDVGFIKETEICNGQELIKSAAPNEEEKYSLFGYKMSEMIIVDNLEAEIEIRQSIFDKTDVVISVSDGEVFELMDLPITDQKTIEDVNGDSEYIFSIHSAENGLFMTIYAQKDRVTISSTYIFIDDYGVEIRYKIHGCVDREDSNINTKKTQYIRKIYTSLELPDNEKPVIDRNTDWKREDQDSFKILKVLNNGDVLTAKVGSDFKENSRVNSKIADPSSSSVSTIEEGWSIYHAFDYKNGGVDFAPGIAFTVDVSCKGSDDKYRIKDYIIRNTDKCWDLLDVEDDILGDLFAKNLFYGRMFPNPFVIIKEARAYQVMCHSRDTEWVWEYVFPFWYFTVSQANIYSCWYKVETSSEVEEHVPHMTVNIYTCGGYKEGDDDNIAYAFLIPNDPIFYVSDMAYFVATTCEDADMCIMNGDFGASAELVQREFWLEFCHKLAKCWFPPETSSRACQNLCEMHNAIFVPFGCNLLIPGYNYKHWGRATSPSSIPTDMGYFWENLFSPLP